MPRVLYYVQHLWGLGHDRRAAAVREFVSEEPNIVVKPLRPDFPDVHGRADVSISQAGYNTAMDVVTYGDTGGHVAISRDGTGGTMPAS